MNMLYDVNYVSDAWHIIAILYLNILPSMWTCIDWDKHISVAGWCGHAYNGNLLQFLYNSIKKSNNLNRFVCIFTRCSRGYVRTFFIAYYSYCFVTCDHQPITWSQNIRIHLWFVWRVLKWKCDVPIIRAIRVIKIAVASKFIVPEKPRTVCVCMYVCIVDLWMTYIP